MMEISMPVWAVIMMLRGFRSVNGTGHDKDNVENCVIIQPVEKNRKVVKC